MADYNISLTASKEEVSDVKSLRFSTKGQPIAFEAGQFLRITLANVTNDPRGPSRFFSIASSPTEKDFVMIATRISQSPFKQALAKLTVGQTVTASGPFGKFTLSDEQEKLHVFLAGGIGITPVRSILKNATDTKLPHKITLLYSNKAPDEIVFKDDLASFAEQNPNLTIIHTITRPEDLSTYNNLTIQQFNNSHQIWETGRINETMIRKYVNDIPNALFYICGPPSMVEEVLMVVKELGVSDENIKTERFTGYQ